MLIAPGHTVPVKSRWLGIFALAFLLPPAPANAIKGKPQVIDGDTIVIAAERQRGDRHRPQPGDDRQSVGEARSLAAPTISVRWTPRR